MRIAADVHISPRTVQFLNGLGHDAVRVTDIMPANAPDHAIIDWTVSNDRVVLTQDLDFSEIVVVSGMSQPSVIQLRLSDAQVDRVNGILSLVLPQLETAIANGIIASVNDDARIRIRQLPVA